jgi:hypothetical protein
MEAIKDTLQKVMQSWGAKVKLSATDEPGVLLKKSLSKKELGHIKFRYFKKGVLGTSVDSSTWLYYFNLQKEPILGKLRQQSDKIKDIRFHIGELK